MHELSIINQYIVTLLRVSPSFVFLSFPFFYSLYIIGIKVASQKWQKQPDRKSGGRK